MVYSSTEGQQLLLACGGGRGSGVWETEGETGACEGSRGHLVEEDGNHRGKVRLLPEQTPEGCFTAANELARAGASPPIGHHLPR